MKRFAMIFVITGLVFNLAETAWFGWNWEPSCAAERACDHVSSFMVTFGIACYLIDILYRLDKFLKAYEKRNEK